MDLIHRDLKPDNILIDEGDVLKLCDLGIVTARNVGGANTEASRSGIGTEKYKSPEQGGFFAKYSSKTDVFSLGLILVELYAWDDEFEAMFDNYRSGIQSDHILDRETAEFVKILTEVNPKCRPTCAEMLEHQFLSYC
ncbi:hypothetical protein PMAYCL1PPCAC_09744 [Pristionchus mayeri]|uniref:Protein kinase domain-containing protein n=1 Tax=Pristionchus mayeri TaxID=1317129 RepID=A0AAN4ZGK1_9BILA|nr:hypothetical protein PMAYCL1PPCAC_09744 [Pristionchus mayeri]